LTEIAPIGAEVGSDRPLTIVHARSEGDAERAAEEIRDAFDIGSETIECDPAVIERITAT
jgi:thymidine phosphorylase